MNESKEHLELKQLAKEMLEKKGITNIQFERKIIIKLKGGTKNGRKSNNK